MQAQDQRHQSLVQIILGGNSPESSSYHALATNACQSHFLFPLSRNIDPAMHASSIHGCSPADTLSSRLVILKSICGLYTPCVSTACFKIKYVRQAHFRKCHSFWHVAPINPPYQIFDGFHHGWEQGARGYSWLEGCTLNPRSGVQAPEVPECSSVVGGWGSTCPIKVHLGIDILGSWYISES